ncbi:hypothetical protein llap_2425 [Limosa lapponica baueri]|uniref:Uncharacterized protein n=1 Tax=Limosa lapponica baueri TaxID=1758121 RepID=A0A2I0UMH7_LIMLA|nr:hypothetical protein llap_2425 [Limosa lapponica baueri]
MLEAGWWPKLFAHMKAGDVKLWIDVFMKGSVLTVDIMLSKADRNEDEEACPCGCESQQNFVSLDREVALHGRDDQQGLPSASGTCDSHSGRATVPSSKCSLVSGETPFIRDTPPHTPRRCSRTSRHVSVIATYFITRC